MGLTALRELHLTGLQGVAVLAPVFLALGLALAQLLQSGLSARGLLGL